ncbi:hypothetical protein RI367_002262 [Sorochytrium milnesiophthora]
MGLSSFRLALALSSTADALANITLFSLTMVLEACTPVVCLLLLVNLSKTAGHLLLLRRSKHGRHLHAMSALSAVVSVGMLVLALTSHPIEWILFACAATSIVFDVIESGLYYEATNLHGEAYWLSADGDQTAYTAIADKQPGHRRPHHHGAGKHKQRHPFTAAQSPFAGRLERRSMEDAAQRNAYMDFMNIQSPDLNSDSLRRSVSAKRSSAGVVERRPLSDAEKRRHSAPSVHPTAHYSRPHPAPASRLSSLRSTTRSRASSCSSVSSVASLLHHNGDNAQVQHYHRDHDGEMHLDFSDHRRQEQKRHRRLASADSHDTASTSGASEDYSSSSSLYSQRRASTDSIYHYQSFPDSAAYAALQSSQRTAEHADHRRSESYPTPDCTTDEDAPLASNAIHDMLYTVSMDALSLLMQNRPEEAERLLSDELFASQSATLEENVVVPRHAMHIAEIELHKTLQADEAPPSIERMLDHFHQAESLALTLLQDTAYARVTMRLLAERIQVEERYDRRFELELRYDAELVFAEVSLALGLLYLAIGYNIKATHHITTSLRTYQRLLSFNEGVVYDVAVMSYNLTVRLLTALQPILPFQPHLPARPRSGSRASVHSTATASARSHPLFVWRSRMVRLLEAKRSRIPALYAAGKYSTNLALVADLVREARLVESSE